MRYGEGDRESENVEDRRGEAGGMFGGGGMGGIPIPIGGGGLSITSLLVIGAICLMLGINPLELLGSIDSAPRLPDIPRTSPRSSSPFELPGAGQRVAPQDDEMSRFVRRVLADTEDVWDRVFQAAGRRYEKPTLVLFTRATSTACGVGQSAMGPFYCPLDHKVYIDLAFYRELKDRFHAPGDFAQAYVIAHEVGHHVQTLLGVANKVQVLKQQALQRGDEREVNRLQVRMELQADCLAGVWGHTARASLSINEEDLREALTAAHNIGDDALGHRNAATFTHGSSEQRMRWFKRGFDGGDARRCDTFAAPPDRL